MTFPASLIRTESGGNWQAYNNEVGAGGHAGHGGRLQFGTARLQDAARAGVVPEMTAAEFARQPQEVQARVEQWHFSDIDAQAERMGLGRFIGQNVGGVTITQNGLRAMAHLGGIGGAARFLNSGGQHNPSDAYGTSLLDYARTHGNGSDYQAAPQQQTPQGQQQAPMNALAGPMGQQEQPQNPLAQPQQPQANMLNVQDFLRPQQPSQLLSYDRFIS